MTFKKMCVRCKQYFKTSFGKGRQLYCNACTPREVIWARKWRQRNAC